MDTSFEPDSAYLFLFVGCSSRSSVLGCLGGGCAAAVASVHKIAKSASDGVQSCSMLVGMLSSAISALFLPFYHLPTRPTVHSVALNPFFTLSVLGWGTQPGRVLCDLAYTSLRDEKVFILSDNCSELLRGTMQKSLKLHKHWGKAQMQLNRF